MKVMINQRRSTRRGFVAEYVPKQQRGKIAQAARSGEQQGFCLEHWTICPTLV